MHAERPADHLPEHRRHDRSVADKDDEGQDNVKEGHERRHQFRHTGDALHPADDDQPEDEGGDASDDRRRHADRVGEGDGDAHQQEDQVALIHDERGHAGHNIGRGFLFMFHGSVSL